MSFSLLFLLLLSQQQERPLAPHVFVPQKESDAPVQPVPYSHKLHLSKGLECKNCHTNPDPGEVMGIPKVAMCMACHRTIKADSPHIQTLAKAAAEKQEIRWKRVYQTPSYVFFSHRNHLEAGATCEKCHGPVRERPVMVKEGDITMGGCMTCHQQNTAPNACNTCHEPR